MNLIYIITGSLLRMSMGYYSGYVDTSENIIFCTALKPDTLKINLSWKAGRIIVGNEKNPVGLIGVYNKTLPFGTTISDTKQAVDFTKFPVTDSSDFQTVSVKGFKLLNTDLSLYRDPQQFWNHFNRPWLESLIYRKATIFVLSNVKNDLLRYGFSIPCDSCGISYSYNNGNYQLIRTGFGKELEFMDSVVQAGSYYWDEISGAYIPIK